MYRSLWELCLPLLTKGIQRADLYVCSHPRRCLWGQGWSRCRTPCLRPTWALDAEENASSTLIKRKQSSHRWWLWRISKTFIVTPVFEPCALSRRHYSQRARGHMGLWGLRGDVKVIKIPGWHCCRGERWESICLSDTCSQRRPACIYTSPQRTTESRSLAEQKRHSCRAKVADLKPDWSRITDQ